MTFIPPNHPQIPSDTLEDPVQAALKWKGKIPDDVLERMLRQLSGKKKTSDKLPSWNDAGIAFPSILSAEQCSSEDTALYKNTLASGARAIDLTGGMGVDTWALAKSFKQVDYVEQLEELCEHARYNFRQLGANNIQVHCSIAEPFLQHTDRVDLIYLDPARRKDSQKVFRVVDCEPRLDLLWDQLLEKADSVLVKLSPLLDLKNLHHQLTGEYEIQVVSVDNECKEILLLRGAIAKPGMYRAVLLGHKPMIAPAEGDTSETGHKRTLAPAEDTSETGHKRTLAPAEDTSETGHKRTLAPAEDTSETKHKRTLAPAEDSSEMLPLARTFSFYPLDENSLQIEYGNPQPDHFLYEPDVALLKAGAFKHIAKWFPVKKAAPNSHLYFSADEIMDFPGRRFKISAVHDFNPKKIKRENPWPKANITVRNFPVDVADIRKQTGIKDGGSIYLFATTLLNGDKVLIEGNKG